MLSQKASLRRQAYAARDAQTEKDAASGAICAKFSALPAYAHAATVMWYCHCRSEVRTLAALNEALSHGGKRIVVPYCTEDAQGVKRLGLWRLHDLAELTPGMWGILEPPRARWGEKGREADPQELDLIMVPGVAFDRHGGRLGNGQGYYDRLLASVRKDCVLSGVCYEAQMFAEVPMQDFDVYMDYILTEQAVYQGKGR